MNNNAYLKKKEAQEIKKAAALESLGIGNCTGCLVSSSRAPLYFLKGYGKICNACLPVGIKTFKDIEAYNADFEAKQAASRPENYGDWA